MHLIQFLLFGGLFLISFYVYRKFKSSVVDILIIFFLLIIGMVFVAFPSLTNKLAHAIGVGRGADMVFYLFIIFFSFVILKLYARIRKLEQLVHTVFREKSISEAKTGKKDKEPSTD